MKSLASVVPTIIDDQIREITQPVSSGMTRYIWLAPADRFFRTYYPTHGAEFVAQWLGIDRVQVYRRARRTKVAAKTARGRPFQRGSDARRHDLHGKRVEIT